MTTHVTTQLEKTVNHHKTIKLTPKDCNNCIFAEILNFSPGCNTAYCCLNIKGEKGFKSKKINVTDEFGKLEMPDWCPLINATLIVKHLKVPPLDVIETKEERRIKELIKLWNHHENLQDTQSKENL